MRRVNEWLAARVSFLPGISGNFYNNPFGIIRSDRAKLSSALLIAAAGLLFAGKADITEMPIVAIEIYGFAPVDFSTIRAALPFHVGGRYPQREPTLDEMPAQIRKAVDGNTFTVFPVFVLSWISA